MNTTRRTFMLGSAAVAAGGLLGIRPAAAADLKAMVDEAAKAGPITWYESSPPEQAAKIVAAFKKTYPNLELQHIRVPGGNDLPARIIQESQAGDGTGDVASGGADHIWALHQRGLTAEIDREALGLSKQMVPLPYAAVSTASVYVLEWNTQAVPDDQVPNSWQDILDPKWKGRVGSWVRALAFVHLAKEWGYDKAKAYLQDFIAQEPLLYKSTFPLAQQVAAGEVDIAVGIYHSAQPPIDAGAPLKVKALDPVPLSTIYSMIPSKARNPAGGAVLIHWLATPEGALAYEAATSRGNPLIAETKTAQLLAGKNVSEFPPDETEEYSRIAEEFNEMLGKGTVR